MLLSGNSLHCIVCLLKYLYGNYLLATSLDHISSQFL
jgi:hypothetical protein